MVRRHEIALLHTPAEAAEILSIRESWLRGKAAARAIPCTFVGKHLRFSDDDKGHPDRGRGGRAVAYAEKRGKGPQPWRVKYKVPGGEASQSGFETKQAALD
jgi:hypothetical protein